MTACARLLWCGMVSYTSGTSSPERRRKVCGWKLQEASRTTKTTPSRQAKHHKGQSGNKDNEGKAHTAYCVAGPLNKEKRKPHILIFLRVSSRLPSCLLMRPDSSNALCSWLPTCIDITLTPLPRSKSPPIQPYNDSHRPPALYFPFLFRSGTTS